MGTSASCAPTAADPDACDPLTLERDPVALPYARLGRPYARAILAQGGQPPYHFELAPGSRLPSGLKLDSQGHLIGVPTGPGRHSFDVRVVDAAGDTARQTYSLHVLDRARPAAKTASAPASAAVISQLDLSQAGPPDSPVPVARVYQLAAAQVDALQAKAAEPVVEQVNESATGPDDPAALTTDTLPSPAGAPEPTSNDAALPALPDIAWSDAQQTQLVALLQPIFGVEYPTRPLFEAAVDALVCAQATTLIEHEAQRQHQQPPNSRDLARLCASPTAPPAMAPLGAVPPRPARARRRVAVAPSGTTQPVAWRDLPAWLMPPGLRDWLVELAQHDRPLQPPRPLAWTPTPSCNCAAPRLQQPLYALYPAWLASAPQAQTIDFSLINRISYIALPLGDNDLDQDQPAHWTEAQTAFIRTAHAHETRVDFGIYRADWRFLSTEPASAREKWVKRYVDLVPRQARALLDTPLPGLATRAQAWLPGFGRVQYMGDGLTVFFDHVPDAEHSPELAGRFADFYPRFIKGLAQALRENRQRHYALNLVVTDRQLAAQPSPFDVASLFHLLLAVEDPQMANGRIVETTSDYKRNSNVELRINVLLSEPTDQSAKALRDLIGNEHTLNESERRIFLRSVVPVLLLPQASLQSYRDQLIYLQDNFGGVGFWPAPLSGLRLSDAQSQALRTTFGPPLASGMSEAVCSVVCPHRWLFRLGFELLLLAGAICWALLTWRCEWRARYGRYALLGGIPPLLMGAALLHCDPALEALRQGNAQLIALIVIPLLAALWALLQRKEEAP